MSPPQVFPAILVAEDDSNDLALLLAGLEEAGARPPIMSFGNGAGIIQFLREICGAVASGEAVPPRVLFLDLHIPQIDGCGVIAWIRKQKALAGLRIVVISGSEGLADVKHAEALGADQLLVKPAPAAVLRAEIARLGEPPPARATMAP